MTEIDHRRLDARGRAGRVAGVAADARIERAARGMAAIGLTAAAGSGLAPRAFLRVFGIPGEDVTGAAAFGWRLFAVRTGYLSVMALRGDEAARAAFLPVQALDQAVFWQAYAAGSVPRRAAVLAAATSAAIIGLDLARRSAGGRDPRRSGSGWPERSGPSLPIP